MIAALYVAPRGSYYGLDGVDMWPASRDARLYDGPWPVVAHPPCGRWCKLAPIVRARYGYEIGDDGGCFAAALASVRRFGGVLEHPAWSMAWAAHGLAHPPSAGGWYRADEHGWACCVDQGHYGHAARKSTWLYAVRCALPSLRWGRAVGSAICSRLTWDSAASDRPRLQGGPASATPVEFRDILIAMAQSVRSQ